MITRLKSNKKTKQFVILGALALVGVLLVSFGNTFTTNRNTKTDVSEEKDEQEAYKKDLEAEIKALCESVRGVGNANVTVSLKGGFSTVYATEQSSSGSEKYVILGSGSSAHGIELCRNDPEILGIGVVCKGGSDPAIQKELSSLLTATYRLSSNRVYIAEAK